MARSPAAIAATTSAACLIVTCRLRPGARPSIRIPQSRQFRESRRLTTTHTARCRRVSRDRCRSSSFANRSPELRSGDIARPWAIGGRGLPCIPPAVTLRAATRSRPENPIRGAAHTGRAPAEDMGVDHGGGHVSVPQELLDGPDVLAVLQQMRGEPVSCGLRAPWISPNTARPARAMTWPDSRRLQVSCEVRRPGSPPSRRGACPHRRPAG
jgi:hypothetical protein